MLLARPLRPRLTLPPAVAPVVTRVVSEFFIIFSFSALFLFYGKACLTIIAFRDRTAGSASNRTKPTESEEAPSRHPGPHHSRGGRGAARGGRSRADRNPRHDPRHAGG